MKDPAFLLYTKDFQSGTQDMSCEEVGAYFRLLLYQHQHGAIPNDEERMMRITGIFSLDRFNQIMEMVKPKFQPNGNHLVNQRLDQIINERSTAKPKKIASATLAGLISADKKLNNKQIIELKKSFVITDFLHLPEEEIKIKVREWFKQAVDQMVDNLANGDANANENKDEKGKEGTGEKPKRVSLVKKSELILPWDTENFRTQWEVWKMFRKKEHNFSYKSEISEQAALKDLAELSGGDEKKAIAIIHQSIKKSWKGLFELNNVSNGKSANNTGTGSGNGYRPASVDTEKLVRELTEDAENGNIPGQY